MKTRKLLQSMLMCAAFASSSQAWLLDGDNYVSVNGSVGLGSIKSETISTQSFGLEFGRNFSPEWYGSIDLEYGVYSIETDNDSNITFGSRAGSAAMKIGYRPTQATLIYGKAGMSGKSGLYGPVFGAGFRWDMFENMGMFAEFSRTSVAGSDIQESYIISSGVVGVQLFLRY